MTNGKASLPNNPCPFLRTLVEGQYIDPDLESVRRLAQIIGEAAGGSAADKAKIRFLSRGIAAIANGLSFKPILRNFKTGLHLNELRGGPLDKKGVNSRIISSTGFFNEAEFNRLKDFARPFPNGAGTELGLGLKELQSMMDQNFARAVKPRALDRKLMDGEWPVLLKIMKKGEGDDSYLSLDELRTLFADRKFPQRISDRIAAYQGLKNPGSATFTG
jgi:hypothetical protein